MKKKVIQKKTDFIRQRKHRDKIRDLLRQTDNLAKEEKEHLEFLTNKIFFL